MVEDELLLVVDVAVPADGVVGRREDRQLALQERSGRARPQQHLLELKGKGNLILRVNVTEGR